MLESVEYETREEDVEEDRDGIDTALEVSWVFIERCDINVVWREGREEFFEGFWRLDER